jgi:hypothetical protein
MLPVSGSLQFLPANSLWAKPHSGIVAQTNSGVTVTTDIVRYEATILKLYQ